MRINELAKMFKVKPQIIYTIVRDFEITGKINVERKGRAIVLEDEALDAVKSELERRGHTNNLRTIQ